MEAIINKKAHFNFFLEDKYEAGIMLQGWELKPLTKRKISLDGTHVIIKNGEAFLLNANITPEDTTDTLNKAEATRTRKLLLHKKEIMQLIGKTEQKGYTLVVTKIYQKRGKFKVEIALAKGKKDHDKRETIKTRDLDREQRNILKQKSK